VGIGASRGVVGEEGREERTHRIVEIPSVRRSEWIWSSKCGWAEQGTEFISLLIHFMSQK
jgi:hypothetical protein